MDELGFSLVQAGFDHNSLFLQWHIIHAMFWILGLAGIGLFHAHWAKHSQQTALNEKKIRESEQRFLDVLYASNDAILLLDDEAIVDCNEAAARMLGFSSRDELLRSHPWELSPPVQPDGRDSFETAQEMIRTAFENGSHRFEWIHRKASWSGLPPSK